MKDYPWEYKDDYTMSDRHQLGAPQVRQEWIYPGDSSVFYDTEEYGSSTPISGYYNYSFIFRTTNIYAYKGRVSSIDFGMNFYCWYMYRDQFNIDDEVIKVWSTPDDDEIDFTILEGSVRLYPHSYFASDNLHGHMSCDGTNNLVLSYSDFARSG